MSRALVIGAGPAGLMAADILAAAGHAVTVADQMPSVGRKFLMAGKSGLNLTKAEPMDKFLAAFGQVPPAFRQAVADFGPDNVTDWAQGLDQQTFVGTTGRVFPVAMKASPLLRAWLSRLDGLGVTFQRRWRWIGWEGTSAVFDTPMGRETAPSDAIILACGGKSWARLGSDGFWTDHIGPVAPFQPANCGFTVNWTNHMARFFGTPVKATRLSSGTDSSRGEWVITAKGIEGGAVYEISAKARDGAPLFIDLLPDSSISQIREKLTLRAAKLSRKEVLQKTLRLSPAKIALFNECARACDFSQPDQIAKTVKALPLSHTGPMPIDSAISTAGGLRFSALDDTFMVKSHPSVFAAGEMLDWEAPTGGYLITGCLATGRAAGLGAMTWLARNKTD